MKALGQALKSAQVSYDSNKLGLEVGVRTNLDVLNQQQQVFQTRFNIAQSYYNYIINALKLKQSVGTLSDEDVEKINRDLARLERTRVRGCGASHATSRSRGAVVRGMERERGGAPSPRGAARSAKQRRDRRRPAHRHRRLRARRRPRARSAVASAKLNMCGPTSVGSSGADRLDQVLPAERKQAAADERDVGGRVVARHLAHRVAEHDFDVGGHGRVAAAQARTARRAGAGDRPPPRIAADGAAR